MGNLDASVAIPVNKSVSLRTRILLTVYILTAIIFLLCAWRILSLSYKLIIENTFDFAIGEQRDFGESLKSYIESLGYDKADLYIREDIFNAVRKHIAYTNREGCSFQIRESDGTLICSSMTYEETLAADLSPSPGASAQYNLKKLGDKRVVFVSSYINLYGFMYRLDYVKDVTASVDSFTSLSWRISAVVFVSILLLPLILFFGIKPALAPLMHLSARAREISNGNYGLRADIVHSDEVGVLANDFNIMVDTLQKHIDMLSETVKLRELFAANLAHELKTPLTSIIGYSDIAGRTEPEKEKLAKIHNYIKNEGKRLDLLSEKLLSWSRIAQTNEIDIKECDSSHIIEHVRHSLNSLLEPKDQSLLVHNQTETLQIDETLFVSLIVNLCANASKASGFGAGIELFLGYDDGSIILKVTDHGIGIAPDELDKLAEPFYMVDKARDRASGGSGLGLTLCDAIVKAHGGSLRIESSPGGGTCVTCTVPNTTATLQILNMRKTFRKRAPVILEHIKKTRGVLL